jgi:hypothetical protein
MADEGSNRAQLVRITWSGTQPDPHGDKGLADNFFVSHRLMPIAALIAPPTLTVTPDSYQASSIEQMNVPAINWTIKYDENGNNNGNKYSGVQPGIQRVAMQVALASQELTFGLPGLFKNGSYLANFFGPAV